ncbi:MAG: hypothetical protein NC898_03955 [Candidatus Omnitrophica bacterium]|nr:hypothetical protein [Candidatus Omnitrophota bacterium]MCM8793602.1 hypothetical protein [Candidatus Omnitrophota bacterium]
MKKFNFIIIVLLIIIIILLLRLPKKEKRYLALQREAPPPEKIQEENPSPIPALPEEKPQAEERAVMKVNFYAIDREKAEKGEFLGTAELREGKLIINVTDPKLKEILEKPYSTMAGEVKEGVAVDYLVTYQPGTIEHLRAIAIECWQFGYIGEIIE